VLRSDETWASTYHPGTPTPPGTQQGRGRPRQWVGPTGAWRGWRQQADQSSRKGGDRRR
jgi:hypothetical protein